MIELANDPNASRASRAERREVKASTLEGQRSRNGHAWPFLSPYAARPLQQDNPKPTAHDCGS